MHDSEIDDYTIGRALSSPLFTQEREDPASRRQAYHSPDESLLSSQSLSVGHVRTGNFKCQGKIRVASENEQIRILVERQEEQILADCREEIQKHEFQADYDRRSIQKLNGVIESQRGEINHALRDYPLPIQKWSDDRWLACLAAGGGSKRRYQYCSDNLGSIIYLRALQGHSGSNLIDPALQDNVLIGPGIFPYIYHVGSNFNLHSIISNGLVPGGQHLSREQTVFFLLVDPRNEDHKDPEYIDYSAPRLARYLQNAWKRHQDAVFWVDIGLGIKEGLMFYQTRSNAIILQGVLPASCIVRVERLKNGEKLYEKQYLSPRPPPKISLRHDLNWSKGNDQCSTVEHQPVGNVVQQSLGETLQSGSSKPTQFPKPIEDRTGQLVTQEIVGKLQGELSSSDRSGQPDREDEKTRPEKSR